MKIIVILEYLWYFVSLAAFVLWLRRTNWGCRAFEKAPARKHQLQFADILFVVLLYIAVSAMVARLLPQTALGESWPKLNIAYLILGAGQLVIAGVIIFIAQQRFAGGYEGFGISRRGLGINTGRALVYFFLATGLTFLVLAITIQFCKFLGCEKIQKHPFLELLSEKPPLSSMILLLINPAFVAPVMEELLFRGMLQSYIINLSNRIGIARRAGISNSLVDHSAEEGILSGYHSAADDIMPRYRWIGITIVAALFALAHAQWQHMPALMVLGLALGYCYERYGNLLVPILMHSLFNILPLAITLSQVQDS